MAKKTRKCAFCKVDDTAKEDMTMVTHIGKKITYKYYHTDPCYPRFLKQKAFMEKEREEMDELVAVIKRIYGVTTLPNTIYPLLQDLRNGNQFFGKRDYKYKEGYSYKLIAQTFDYVSDSIEYANAHKNFYGFTQAFRYGLAIVCDKLMVVENMNRQSEQQERKIEANLQKTADSVEEQYQSNYKPKKSTKSITDFLDD